MKYCDSNSEIQFWKIMGEKFETYQRRNISSNAIYFVSFTFWNIYSTWDTYWRWFGQTTRPWRRLQAISWCRNSFFDETKKLWSQAISQYCYYNSFKGMDPRTVDQGQMVIEFSSLNLETLGKFRLELIGPLIPAQRTKSILNFAVHWLPFNCLWKNLQPQPEIISHRLWRYRKQGNIFSDLQRKLMNKKRCAASLLKIFRL